MISRLKVVFSSGCVTCALFIRSPASDTISHDDSWSGHTTKQHAGALLSDNVSNISDQSPEGLMNLSYLGGFRVKPWPTKVTLVTMRFQLFFFRLPDLSTLNISSSATGRTCYHWHTSKQLL